jgi:hypothetical protein
MTSGGKDRGAARARSLLQPGQAVVEEALAPEADHVATHRERGRDGVIALALRRQENHLGPQDCIVWQRIFPGTALQNLPFGLGEGNAIGALSRHPDPSSLERRVAEKVGMDKKNMLPYLSD